MASASESAAVGSGTTVSVTPYLCVKGAADAIEFYRQAFGAVETLRIPGSNGRIGHAEIRIGGAPIFLADEFPEIDVLSPQSIGGSPVLIHLTVPNVDTLFAQAITAGATVLRPVADQGHGMRNGKLTDPFGHNWMLTSFSEAGSAGAG